MGLKTQTLVQCLIECAECDSYRSGTRTDRWHVKADQKLLNKVGGLSQLLIQAKELERIAGISHQSDRLSFRNCLSGTD